MGNIALQRNYYHKISRGDQGHFFGLYAGNYYLSMDEAIEILYQVAPIFARRQTNIVTIPIKSEKQGISEKFLAGSDGKLVRREEGRGEKNNL